MRNARRKGTVFAMEAHEMGQVLRGMRGKRPLWDVAYELGMSGENLRHYESGRNRIPAPDIPRFAAAYRVSSLELIRKLGLVDDAEPLSDDDEARFREMMENPEVRVLFAAFYDDWREASPEDRRMLVRGMRAAQAAILAKDSPNGHA